MSSTKSFTIALLIGSSIECCAQNRPESVERSNYGCWASNDAIINKYADSLNFWTSSLSIPKFVFQPNFDWMLMGLGNSCFVKQQYISYRKAILDRVVNDQALSAIIELPDLDLDKTYDPKELEKKSKPSVHSRGYPDLPFMKYSTRQLSDRRLKELSQKRKALLENKK